MNEEEARALAKKIEKATGKLTYTFFKLNAFDQKWADRVNELKLLSEKEDEHADVTLFCNFIDFFYDFHKSLNGYGKEEN